VDDVGPSDVRCYAAEQRMGEARLGGPEAPGRQSFDDDPGRRSTGLRLVAADHAQFVAAALQSGDVTFAGARLAAEARIDVVGDEQDPQLLADRPFRCSLPRR